MMKLAIESARFSEYVKEALQELQDLCADDWEREVDCNAMKAYH